MANKRITDVDFIDVLNSNESFFINQNNTLRQISKKNVVMEVANGGTGATDAATALTNLGAMSVTGGKFTGDVNMGAGTNLVLSDGTNVGAELYNINSKWAGCEIRFEDEDGNPTDEPYIHWYVEE